ncbi:MAG: InlB B-repeat-containing protein, partial [Oscillospiraceae bacterium]|nr:InlB B-repeat-containing protein [Oscillospiraceae bacterium]
IPAGKTLTIPSDTSLTIPEERTLTIPKNAALTNSGGTLTNSGKIYVDGTFTGTADNTYYPLTLVKAAAAGDISEHNDKTYGKTGSDIALTPDTPSTGQEFKQWVVSGVDVTVDENNKFTMPSAAITVSAQFGPATYRIIYEGKNTIENAGALPQTHTYGTATAIPNLTRTGYSFQGWKVNNGETPVKNLTLGATDYTAMITLTPVWTVNQYTISYGGMEGAEYGEYHPAIHTYDTATTISNPTRTGYSFQGWKVNDGETPVKDLTLGATDYTEGISLTAVWTVNQYNIAYEGMEGAEYGEYHPAIHTYDTATTISDPARIGHTFQGWMVNGGETPVKDLTLDGKGYTDNITLTAVWTVDTYTVTLNLNGGTVNSGNVAEYTYGVGAVLPTQVTRINYFFMGWYDNEALTGDPVTAIGTDETGEREYWARWIYVPSQSGWKELEPGSSYYQNGLKVKGLQEIDGKTYYFDEKGYLQAGWVELDGGWYYFDSDLQTGWVKVDGCWYFFDPDTGVMAENSWVLSKGVWYYLGEGGAMLQSRWLLWNDAWYYLGTDGTMLQSRWLQWNGAWYYLGTDGIMLANRWLQWNGAWYYLGTDGVMLTNAVTPDGYKVDASGVWVK